MFENFVETLQRGGTPPNRHRRIRQGPASAEPFGAGATPAAINAANTAMQAMKNRGCNLCRSPMDNTGKLMVPAGNDLRPYADKLQQTDYLIQGVVGSIT
jgi:simple sugar transport system substrate-binding protein